MTSLYDRLRQVGLPRAYVQNALPEWWDDEAAATPSGYQHGLLILAQHLGLDFETLIDPSRPVAWKSQGRCKFKRPLDISEDRLAVCRSLALRFAQLAAVAAPEPKTLLAESAAAMRRAILDRGVRWVGLPELLDYCWSAGVPVLHLDAFPKGACRPDGLAANVAGRPVIVLCKRAKQPAWLLFILAHELGHLALGHVAEGESILDAKIREDDQETEEAEANSFAAELLTGSPPRRFRAADRWPAAESLAEEAKRIAAAEQIDPGHVVLNYAHAMGSSFYAVANKALARLDPRADAVRTVRGAMADRLDWSQLPTDTSEFLMRVAHDGAGR